MVLSKLLSYAAVAIVSFIIGGEICHYFASKYEKKLLKDTAEINEIVFTRQPIENETRLTKGIVFDSDKIHHATDIVKHLITSAQNTIHLAMYILTSEPLTEALLQARAKGIELFVIVDGSMRNSSSSKIDRLASAGVNLRIANPTMHHKLCLIDVPYDRLNRKLQNPVKTKVKRLENTFDKINFPEYGVTITGSLNWTRDALLSNRENFTVTSNRTICERSAREFFDIWDDGNEY